VWLMLVENVVGRILKYTPVVEYTIPKAPANKNDSQYAEKCQGHNQGE
jgi:hypothetical protein